MSIVFMASFSLAKQQKIAHLIHVFAIKSSCSPATFLPEGMVRTFTHEEPSSFETLGSQFSLS